MMLNPNASSIENAIILFAVVAPGLGLLYLAAHVLRRRRRRRETESELSPLDVLDRQ